MNTDLAKLIEQELKIPLEDVLSITFDKQIIHSDTGELIVQLSYFTINMIYGEFLELPEESPLYEQLYTSYLTSPPLAPQDESLVLYVKKELN